MTQKASLITGAFRYGTVSAIALAATFLSHLLLGRELGSADYGRLSSALAFAVLAMPLLDPGFYYLIIREISRDPRSTSTYLSNGLAWKILAGPLYLSICVGGYFFIQGSTDTLPAAVAIALAGILQASSETLRSALLGHQKFGWAALPVATSAFLLLGGLAIMAFWGELTLVVAAGLICMVRFCELLLGYTTVSRVVGRIRRSVDRRFLKSMLQRAVPIGVFYITLSIYNYIDVVMIAIFRPATEVGWYAASYRLYEGPVFVPAVLGSVFLPYLSRFSLDEMASFARVAVTGLRTVTVAAALIATNVLFFAGDLTELTFGPEFANSAISLRMLSVGLYFLFVLNFLQNVFISMDRQLELTYVAAGGLAANVVLNLVLIPMYGFLGAAFATVAIEILVCVTLCVRIRAVLSEGGFFVWLLAGIPLVISAVGGTYWVSRDWSHFLPIIAPNAILLALLSIELFRPNGLYVELKKTT